MKKYLTPILLQYHIYETSIGKNNFYFYFVPHGDLTYKRAYIVYLNEN